MLDSTFQRRREIERMLLAGQRLTVSKMMARYGVGRKSISGVFITENYKPYANTLTQTELETLCRLYRKSKGKEKEILFRIIHKYGADKLKI